MGRIRINPDFDCGGDPVFRGPPMGARLAEVADHTGNVNDPAWRAYAIKSLSRAGRIGEVRFEQHGPLAVAFAEPAPFSAVDFFTSPIETRDEAESLAR